MNFDYYASIAEDKACPSPSSKNNLSPCFSYGCDLLSHLKDNELACTAKPYNDKPDAKNDARLCYIERAKKDFPSGFTLKGAQLIFEPSFDSLKFKNAIGIEIHFTLKTPWYSKDDRPFHVLDNPVKKDWVFGIPYMSATDWKGMLRWACRMQVPEFNEHLKGKIPWKDPAWIIHLFGNEKDEKKDFLQGALRFFPTFFNKVNFEVINPHSRTTKAGTLPIYYEVVPNGTSGILYLLYTPARPKGTVEKFGERKECLFKLIDAINILLTEYGISAKRTAGWGACKIEKYILKTCDFNSISVNSLTEFKETIEELLDEMIEIINEGSVKKDFPGYLIV
jgi:CRISPR-associated protein Cmr2